MSNDNPYWGSFCREDDPADRSDGAKPRQRRGSSINPYKLDTMAGEYSGSYGIAKATIEQLMYQERM